MSDIADLPELPDDVLQQVFSALYGSGAARDGAIEELCHRHPERAAAIRAHAAHAHAAQGDAMAAVGAGDAAQHWSLAAGTIFGPYEIVATLGSGGMGTVFAARHRVDGSDVALKVLHPDVLRQRSARERFRREAEALARLRHPGVCALLAFGEHEDCPFLAMRLVAGQSLAERIAEARRHERDGRPPEQCLLPPEQQRSLLAAAGPCVVPAALGAVLHLIEQLARALHAAHEAGVVHRDVKPGNVMLDPSGGPVLVDFGLAHHPSASTLTATGDLLGTPAYMAPEQIAHRDGDLDAQVDVYSLGVVLYECLTLRPPFTAGSHGALLAAIGTGTAPALGDLRPDLPESLDRVTAKAFARDRRQRYRSARDLADELQRIRRGVPVLAQHPGPWVVVRSFIARNRTFTAATTVVLLVVAVLAVLAALVTAEQHEVDLLASAAVVASAQAAEAELWPATPDKEAKFVAWLERFATPTTPGSLPDRMHRLEQACGCTADQVLADERARHRTTRRTQLQQELASLQQLQPVAGPDAMSELDIADFRLRRGAWLRTELARIDQTLAQPTRPRAPGAPAHHEALLAVARYVVDGAETEDRHGAVRRIAAGLQRLRRADHGARDAEAWREAARRAASGIAPYRTAIDLAPQQGLVPIGTDPASGMLEFAVGATGSVPVRGADGRLLTTPDSAIVLVLLPGGSTTIGTSEVDHGLDALAFPAHRVALDPFFLAKFETTQAQWLRMGGGRPSRLAAGSEFLGERFGALHPVESVDAPECREVLRWHGLTLPTEAQWEQAARASQSATALEDLARERHRDNTAAPAAHRPLPPFTAHDEWDGSLLTTPIGTWRANAFGLFDLGGNVSEWCDDRFGPYWAPVRRGDGRRLSTWGNRGVVRGANYMLGTPPHVRLPVPQDLRMPLLGVRAARSLE